MRWGCVGFVMLAACAAEPEETFEDDGRVDFAQPGAFTPGTSSTEITGSEGLSLKVETWFPSQDEGRVLVAHDGFYGANAYTDVAPDCAKPRPVLVFSHGNSGIRWQSPFFVEHLATHGYVVAAPDHTFNTVFDDDPMLFDELVVRRPRDVRDVFDWLVSEGQNPESELYGCIDPDAGYAVAGHSFGGYTALAAAGALVWTDDGESNLGDERVWASVPLAPWDARDAITDGTRAIEVPVMILTGDADTITDLTMVNGLYDPLTVSPRYYGRFTGGTL